MEFKYFSHNGALKLGKAAAISLGNIEYQYGFGVYETVRVVRGVPYFLSDHLARLVESAKLIALEHPFSLEEIGTSVTQLVAKNAADTCNLKLLLVGAKKKEEAQLFILCLNPLFPDKKLYQEGANFVTYGYERPFPHAKTLNMLQSYLAYRKAQATGCYDALLIDNNGCITEGTRTNFFCIQGRTLVSPPDEKILLGVTRRAVLKVAADRGYDLRQQEIRWGDIKNSDGAFITSTSSKIIPVHAIDEEILKGISDPLRELMRHYDAFLDSCGGELV